MSREFSLLKLKHFENDSILSIYHGIKLFKSYVFSIRIISPCGGILVCTHLSIHSFVLRHDVMLC